MSKHRPCSNYSLAGIVSVLGMMTSLAAVTLSGALPIIDDEFRTDNLFEARQPKETEMASGSSAAGVWADGKISVAGLLSLQWLKQEVRLGKLEYFALSVVALYIVVYARGRRRNYELAYSFIHGAHDLFCSRFLEAGAAEELKTRERRHLLSRESCSTFHYYATGSRYCSSVLLTISLANRHDLFMLLYGFFSHKADTVTIEVALDEGDMEPLVFAVTRKRDMKKLLQEVPHLQDYAAITRTPALPSGLVCLSETGVLMEPMLQPTVTKILAEYPDLLELMYFTDQNQEPILGREHTPTKVLRFRFRLAVLTTVGDRDKVEAAKMVELVLFYMEYLHRYKMVPGVRKKAMDRREAVAKRKAKLTHAQRQERYQQLKFERLQREREEYENLTPEQKRRRDVRDEKKAKKSAASKKLKMKLAKS